MMKSSFWMPVVVAIVPLSIAGIFGFTDLKSDVRVLESAWAAGEDNYTSLDNKVGAIQRDLRNQGTSQAVTAEKIKGIEKQLKELEKSSSEQSRIQADLLRTILNEVRR